MQPFPKHCLPLDRSALFSARKLSTSPLPDSHLPVGTSQMKRMAFAIQIRDLRSHFCSLYQTPLRRERTTGACYCVLRGTSLLQYCKAQCQAGTEKKGSVFYRRTLSITTILVHNLFIFYMYFVHCTRPHCEGSAATGACYSRNRTPVGSQPPFSVWH